MSSSSGKLIAYQTGKSIATVALLALIVLFVVFSLPLLTPHVQGLASYPVVRELIGVEKSLAAPIRAALPQDMQARGIFDWLLPAAIFSLALVVNNVRAGIRRKIQNLEAAQQFESLSASRHIPKDARVLAPLKEKLDGLQESSKPEEREELLRVFAETKKKLDAMGRDLAFLAVDVVDSTGMKVGEEQGIIERDFREYKKLVEGKIKEAGALKSAWTPDGVMVCLPSVDAAVRLAQELITSLEGFNKHVKCMKRDFQVRCGINYGYVYFDPAVPMEEMSDRVIDVAGHMQKYALPNSIAIAKQAIEPVHSRAGFVTAGRVVDGYEVYIWPKEEGPAPG